MPAQKGFTVVEIVVAAALIASIVTAIAGAWQLYLKLSNQTAGLTAAALLAEEGGEALGLMRDQGWTANIVPLSIGTTYYLYWNGSAYAVQTSPVVVGGNYVRSFTLSYALRDGNYNYTGTSSSCGGSCDADTRDAFITVSFASSTAPLVQSEILIHNVFKN